MSKATTNILLKTVITNHADNLHTGDECNFILKLDTGSSGVRRYGGGFAQVVLLGSDNAQIKLLPIKSSSANYAAWRRILEVLMERDINGNSRTAYLHLTGKFRNGWSPAIRYANLRGIYHRSDDASKMERTAALEAHICVEFGKTRGMEFTKSAKKKVI